MSTMSETRITSEGDRMTLHDDPAGNTCLGIAQPGRRRLQQFILGRWGGSSLGIYNCRTIREGHTLSLHAEGRAFDWATPSRTAFDDAASFLVANADALNVQAVHDYANQKLWRPDRGWHSGKIGKGVAGEMHVERNWAGAHDDRAIADIVHAPATPAAAGNPLAALAALVDHISAHPLKFGATGDEVRFVQNALNARAAKNHSTAHIAVNGVFDANTRVAITFFQTVEHLRVDGKVGKATLAALLQ
jgi:hypothetical protein